MIQNKLIVVYLKYMKGNENPIIKKSSILFTNFVFQNFLSVDKTERWFKVFLEFFLIALLSLFGLKLIYSIVVAHLWNYICNSNLHSIRKAYHGVETDYNTFIDYLNSASKNASAKKGILGIAVYGGVSKGRVNKYSDIDVKIVRETGIKCGITVCLYVLKERCKAFISGFPLDICVLDDVQNYDANENNEIPLIIYDPKNALAEFYGKWRIMDQSIMEELYNAYYSTETH